MSASHVKPLTQGLLATILLAAATPLAAEDPPVGEAERSGALITIRGTVDTGLKYRVLSAARAAARRGAETIIFDLQAANSDFDVCYGLASEIVNLGGGVKRTVAYVSQTLVGHGVLVALACDEIVMAPGARIGDVYKDRPDIGSITEETAYRDIANKKRHGLWIAMGMVDKNLRLFEISTPNGKVILPEEKVEAFAKDAKILKQETVKEPGERLLLDAKRAQALNLITLIAGDRAEVASAYRLPESVLAEDKLLGDAARPVLIKIEGTVDGRTHQYVLRRLRQAQDQGSNLVFVQIDSASGDESAASSIAGALRDLPNVKRVAWVKTQALGPAAMILFGCDELVMAPTAVIGDFQFAKASPREYQAFAENAVSLAEGSKFPQALVRGFMDPAIGVFQVTNKQSPALVAFKTNEELEQPGAGEEWINPRPVKEKGVVLRMDGEKAYSLDFAVALVSDERELAARYDLGDRLQVLKPGWTDAIVDGLTSSGGTVFLLVVGFFCLYIEFQLPGFGIGGLISAICFVLFFWSRYLSETANSLEIVMFLLGIVFIVIELFVLPGFGVTGIAGACLLFGSLLLASQSFAMPRTESEMAELVRNAMTLAASLFVFIVSAATLGRFFPRVPWLGRMVLAPPGEVAAEEEFVDPFAESSVPNQDLLGRQGVAASPLRPAGRMQFNDRFFDVVTRGEFIEPGTPVEVVAVYNNRIVVRDANTRTLY